MTQLFTAQYSWLWILALALALFLPVRQLIWVLYIRRAERTDQIDDTHRAALKRRAGATSTALCFVFAYFYVSHLFRAGS